MKKVVILLMILIAGSLLTACGNRSSDSIQAIQENGVLKVGVIQTNTALLQKGEDGTSYSGTESELAQSISDALGVKISYVEMDKDQIYNNLNSGLIDIALGSITYDGSLANNYGVSTSYASGFLYVVTPKGYYADSFGTFTDTTVGIPQGMSDTTTSTIAAIKDVKINTYKDDTQIAKDLTEGVISGYFCYQKEAEDLLSMGSFQVQNLINVDKEQYVILTRARDTELLDGINTLITQFVTSSNEEVK